jgi:hypothetical protein
VGDHHYFYEVIATTPVGRWTMTEERIVRLRTNRNNIDRYRRLLKTNLSEIERQYLERRLSEEQAEMEMNMERG